jgi:hypothetical protein
MKQSVRFIAMLLACFAINFFFSSCNRKAKFAKTGQKLVGPIHIIGYSTANSSLTLRDSTTNNDAVYVLGSRTQKINWNVTSNASKVEIIDISADPNYHYNDPNFFSTPPYQQGNNFKHWQAIIGSPNPGDGIIFEKYYIKWKLNNSPTIYTFDPLLQLNP